jgi:hypothetical protein
VIRIRYADLPAGLHIQVVARGKDTIVYLLPGLTNAQRQAALRRARTSGRMGQGPRLPAAGVAAAKSLDRVRTTVRNGAAAVRAHPAVFVPPVVIITTAAIAYVLLVSVSIQVREPQASGPGRGGAPVAAAIPPPPAGKADDPGSQPSSSWPGSSGKPKGGASERPGRGHRATGTPSPSSSASPAPSGSQPASSPAPSLFPTPTPTSVSSPSPDPSAGGTDSDGSGSGSGSGSSGGGGLCLDVGPLGVCL